MEPDHMLDQQVSGLQGGRQLWEGNKMNRLGELIKNGQNGLVTFRGREACDELVGAAADQLEDDERI